MVPGASFIAMNNVLEILKARGLFEDATSPEVFKLVALHFSQAEAQCRLDRLNRHFPTRSPRSGFAPLDPHPRESRLTTRK